MKKVKTVLSTALVFVMLALIVCSPAAFAQDETVTVIAQGNCGVMGSGGVPADNATFTITSDGVMTVSGEGSMADYYSTPNSQPWQPYRDSITSLVIEPGVTRVGDRCFWLCKKLVSISLPDTLIEIARGAFYLCNSLESLTLPDSLRVIGGSAFRECSKLRSVSLPAGVSVDDALFRDCYCLREAVLPEGLTAIPEDFFNGCEALKTVTVPASVRSVEKRAFCGCDLFTDVYYLAPLAQWQSVGIDDSPELQSLSTQSANKPLERAVIHSHVAGGGTSGVAHENTVSQPTCVRPAGYDKVERCNIEGCGFEIARTFVQTAPATGVHTQGEAVRENKVAETCLLPGGYDEVVYCSVCGGELERNHVNIDPVAHANAYTVAGTEATNDEHGYTKGDYCPDCDTWISGHEVVHNTLGERVYLDEYTEDGEQMVRIKCTVCGGEGLYAMEPVPASEPQPSGGDSSPLAGIRKAIRSVIDFLLRLLRWFSSTR